MLELKCLVTHGEEMLEALLADQELDNHTHNNPGHDCDLACVERSSLWAVARTKRVAVLRKLGVLKTPPPLTDEEFHRPTFGFIGSDDSKVIIPLDKP